MKWDKITLLLLLALVVVGDTFTVQARKKNASRYKLVFCDEFNLPNGSQPDTAVWGRSPRAHNLWAKWNSDVKDVVTIRDGKLVCRVIPNTNPKDTAVMLAGAVNTKGRFTFQYGKVEVRMKTNVMEGNFPAAWLRPQNDGNPYSYGEMDIVEYFGRDGVARQTIHSHRSAMLGKTDIPSKFQKTGMKADQWHIYGVEWTPTSITTLIDGEVTGTYLKSTDKTLLSEGQWTFDRPFFIILNQSVGYGSWHTPDTKATYETEFDWVRVYQKQQ